MLPTRLKILVVLATLGIPLLSVAGDELRPKRGVLPDGETQLNGFRLGVSSLDDVVVALGPATRFQSHGEGSATYVCYTDHVSVVAFEAGPLGGWKTLTAYIMADAHTYPDINHCSSNGVVTRLTMYHPYFPRMEAERLRNLLGEPTRTGDRIEYSFVSEQVENDRRFYVTSGLQLTINGNAVDSARVFLLKSN